VEYLGVRLEMGVVEIVSLSLMGVPVPGMRAKVKYHKGWVRVVESHLGLVIFHLCPHAQESYSEAIQNNL